MKHFFTTFSVILIVSATLGLQAQVKSPASIWYFGDSAGIDFKSQVPDVLYDGITKSNNIIKLESTGVISSEDGDLLFYTDGVNVYNKIHSVMLNGSNLDSFTHSSSQANLILNHPDNDSLYYVMITPFAERPNDGMRFHVINMNGDGGLGEVTDTFNLLHSNSSEKVSAYYHANGRDIWVIGHEYGNNCFFLYLLTKDGFINCPVKQCIGVEYKKYAQTVAEEINQGFLKFSPNGKYLAHVFSPNEPDTLSEVYSFNNLNGELELIKQIKCESNNPWGVEFSRNSENLFLIDSDYKLICYNLLLDSIKALTQYDFPKGTSLSLGPDSNIYIGIESDTFLHIIENANDFSSFTIDSNYINLSPGNFGYGFPNIFTGYLTHGQPRITYENNCDSMKFDFSVAFENLIDKWIFTHQNLSESLNSNDDNPAIKFTDTGLWLVECVLTSSDTIYTTVYVEPSVVKNFLGENIYVCEKDTVKLSIPDNASCYLWQDSISQKSIVTIDSGFYHVTFVTPDFCVYKDTVKITHVLPPLIDLGNDTILCGWDSIILNSNYHDSLIHVWLPGNDSTNSIVVKTEGVYSLFVTNSTGCTGNDSIFVGFNSIAQNDSNNYLVCDSSFINLKGMIPDNYDTIYWNWEILNDTVSTDSFYSANFDTTTVVFQTMNFTYRGIECSQQDSITIEVSSTPDVSIGNDTIICGGETVLLVSNYQDSFVHLWLPDSDTTTSINVSKEGLYKLFVTNNEGCRGEDSVFVGVNPLIQLDSTFYKFCDSSTISFRGMIPLNYDSINWEWEHKGIIAGIDSFYTELIDSNTVIYHRMSYHYRNLECSQMDSIILEVGYTPLVFAGNDTIICGGESVLLMSDNPDSLDHLWLPGNDTTQSIIVSTENMYRLFVTNAEGCTGIDSVFVGVNPMVNPDSTLYKFCDSSTISFRGMVPSNYDSINWEWEYNGNIAGIDSVYTEFIDTTSVIYHRMSYYYRNLECSQSDSMIIMVGYTPLVFAGNDTIVCGGESVLLMSDNPDSLNHLWLPGNDTTQSILVSVEGMYNLFVTNKEGCTGVDSVFVGINQLVEPDSSVYRVCGSSTINLRGLIPQNFDTATWEWEINGLIVSTDSTLSLNYDSSTIVYHRMSYEYRGIVCYQNDSFIIDVDSIPPDVFIGNDTIICEGGGVILTSNQPNNFNHLWLPGNETTESIFITNEGFYELIVTNLHGCVGNDSIFLGVNPVYKLDSTLYKICANNELSLKGMIPADYDTVIWDWNILGSNVGNDSVLTLVYNNNTIIQHTMSYTYRGIECSQSDSFVVETDTNPVAMFIVNDSISCLLNNEFEATDISSPTPVQRWWINQNGDSSTDENYKFSFQNSGNYTLVLKIENNYGCRDSTSKTFYIHPQPQSNLTVNRILVCQDSNLFSVDYNSTIDTGNIVFKRLFWGDGKQSIASPDTHSYADSGLYLISFTTVSNLGCESTISELVRVYPLPTGEIEVLNACENSVLEIKSTNTGSESAYHRIDIYDTSGISQYIAPDSSALHLFDSSGTSEANFILHMVNDAGCTNQNSYTIPLDTASFVSIEIDTLENQTLRYRFTGSGDNIQSWKWTSNKGHSSDDRIWEIQFDETGSVIITLTATNINGCETVVNIPFSVEYFIHFFVPTAFSPNGDGHNDKWKVEGMLFFKEFNLKVYNRWGQQIWESNDANEAWDGNGVPIGAYTYILNATDILNRTHEDKGVLFLER